MGGTEHALTMAESAFAAELRLRLAEAQASLDSAERLDDPLLAQIAASGLADLRSLAARNDLPTDAVSRS
jgi:hypothetical protein